jgi:UDP-glucose:glycoprotein glucosyltransferase
VLITGSCEDVTSRDPPNGLQLLLGTSAQPHVTDTLVMSNLGYFQLKATPGAWTLQVSSPAHATPKTRTARPLTIPGPSDDVAARPGAVVGGLPDSR